MPNCYYFNCHFKATIHNDTTICDSCIDTDPFIEYDDDDKLTIQNLLNPTGKTQAFLDTD